MIPFEREFFDLDIKATNSSGAIVDVVSITRSVIPIVPIPIEVLSLYRGDVEIRKVPNTFVKILDNLIEYPAIGHSIVYNPKNVSGVSVVKFYVNGLLVKTESGKQYAIAGDKVAGLTPFEKKIKTLTIHALNSKGLLVDIFSL